MIQIIIFFFFFFNNSLLTYFRQVAIYKLKVQILKYPRFKTLKKKKEILYTCVQKLNTIIYMCKELSLCKNYKKE